ncbi:uncharacterized protein LOC115878406 isoform X2 [Sitophilus oryzae]|uniref:Uncharacterized protein LOC115878406 isoform X2 n=1 Tax=Sitophilus oryzae TaxID=7048 RepID=A0A6J2XH64_SITOR|nr:uncharacterized protein LOC115878406 isoform X2 [Sitophilus oryzae]
MESDKSADNEKELTSTSSSDMSQLLSTNKEEKSDSSDTLPTSSTDASTSFKSTNLVSDDPISSTSSEMDSNKAKKASSELQKPNFDAEEDLLDISISNQPAEKIEENVDDLVNDLETLLGESSESYNLSFRGAKAIELEKISDEEARKSPTKCLLEDEVSSNTTSSIGNKLNSELDILTLDCATNIETHNLKDSDEGSSENIGIEEIISDTVSPSMEGVTNDLKVISDPNIADLKSDSTESKTEKSSECYDADDVVTPQVNDNSVKLEEQITDQTADLKSIAQNVVEVVHESAENKIDMKCVSNDVDSKPAEIIPPTEGVSSEKVLCLTDIVEKESIENENEKVTIFSDDKNSEISEVIDADTKEEVVKTDNDEAVDVNISKVSDDIELTKVSHVENDLENNENSATNVKNDEASEKINTYDETPASDIENIEKTTEVKDNFVDNDEDGSHDRKIEQGDNNVSVTEGGSPKLVQDEGNSNEADDKSNDQYTFNIDEENSEEEDSGTKKKTSDSKSESLQDEKEIKEDLLDADVIPDKLENEASKEKSLQDTTEILSGNVASPNVDTPSEELDIEPSNAKLSDTNVNMSENLAPDNSELKEMETDEVENYKESDTSDALKPSEDKTNLSTDTIQIEMEKQVENVDYSKSVELCETEKHDNLFIEGKPAQLEQVGKSVELSEAQGLENSAMKCEETIVATESAHQEPEENPQSDMTSKTADPPQSLSSQSEADDNAIENEKDAEADTLEASKVADPSNSISSQSETDLKTIENEKVAETDTLEASKVVDPSNSISSQSETDLKTIENEKVAETDTLEASKVVDSSNSISSQSETDPNTIENEKVAEADTLDKEIEIKINEEESEAINSESVELEPKDNYVKEQKLVKQDRISKVSEEVIKNEDLVDAKDDMPIIQENLEVESESTQTMELEKESVLENTVKNQEDINVDIKSVTASLKNPLEAKSSKVAVVEAQNLESEIIDKSESETGVSAHPELLSQKPVPMEQTQDDNDTENVEKAEVDIKIPDLSETENKASETKTELSVESELLPQKPVPDEEEKHEDTENVKTKEVNIQSQNEVEALPKKLAPTTSIFDEKKTISEINIRRKTVEQDLEKVVCLSEESSDSDASSDVTRQLKKKNEELAEITNIDNADDSKSGEQVTTSATAEQEDDVIHDVPLTEESLPNEEEIDLIQIAKEVEQLQNNEETEPISEVRSEESMTSIDDLLPQQSLTKIEDTSILPVNKLQASQAKQGQEDITLSDKELREIEAIRAAVASITDSSQDTYDSYIVESSATPIDNIAEISMELPELSCGITEIDSGNSQNASEPIIMEETAALTISSISEISNSEKTQEVGLLKKSSDSNEVSVEIKPEIQTEKPSSQEVQQMPNSSGDVSVDVTASVSKIDSVEQKDESLSKEDDISAKDAKNKENVSEEISESSKVTVEENEVVESDTSLNDKSKNKGRKVTKVNEPLSINVDEGEREKVYSPKITIKPLKVPDDEVSTTSDAEINKGSLKMTITKQSDKMHSILKVFNPEDNSELETNHEEPIPKLIIKPKAQTDQQHSPKITRSAKVYSPTSTQRCASPRITIKPVVKPAESKSEALSPLKITFKPVVKPEDVSKRQSPKSLKEPDLKNHNPKITIKPIQKPSEQEKDDVAPSTPKVTIKPVKRHIEETDLDEERSSPKITIKPLVRPTEDVEQSGPTTPRLIIKPIKKQEDEADQGRSSPKISIKPIVKHPESEIDDEEVKERIVLKINKGNLPTPVKDKKREHPDEEKTGKIKLKFLTSGGHTHIVQDGEESNKRQKKDVVYAASLTGTKNVEESSNKRLSEERQPEKNKRLRSSITPEKDVREQKLNSPIVINDDSRSQNSSDSIGIQNTSAATPDISKISELASRTTHIEASPVLTVGVATPTSMPKKRGRPRKVPLEIRPELTDSLGTQSSPDTSTGPSPSSTPEGVTTSGGRPKRSCRGQGVIATLGIKPRKPRGRGRGSKVNMGDRMPVVEPVTPVVEPVTPVAEPETSVSPTPIESTPVKPEKEQKVSKARLKLMQSGDEEAKKQEAEQRNLKQGAAIPEKSVKVQEKLGKEVLKVILEARLPEQKYLPKNPSDSVAKQKPAKSSEITEKKLGEHLKGITITKVPSNAKSTKTSTQFHASDFTDTVIILSDDDDTNPEVKQIENSDGGKTSEEPKVEEKLVESESGVDMTEGRDLEEATGDDDAAVASDDSEEERKKALMKQRKLEAIRKCREKRLEKLAKAAEMKKKRQEQAKQQREARIAAEEAEKTSSDKSKTNKRYGRYGTPKPQISLVDEPVKEAGGTVKSPRGLFDSVTEDVKISQPIVITDEEDSNLTSNQSLKQIETSNLSLPSTSNQSAVSPQKFVPEPMAVDSEEGSLVVQAKFEHSIASDDVVMIDEETRMSADLVGSRAQTPAKQTAAQPETIVEDSQSSLGAESVGGGKSKSSKAPRLEVFQEPDTNVLTVDQLAEYMWNGQGPFMLQEQVAQFLGIKSFKRKYPNVARRPVDMQERDYLKENALATETLCDLGLTAVNASDILDIMYSDFQEKYEEYCKAQREKQARELAIKQKALSSQQALKQGTEKMDIIEQAIQSAAQWNKQFNKERNEQRKASMDLQNLTVHYPKSKTRVQPKDKTGNYPVALVPGQFTDYYNNFTPTELNNLPLNTMCYDEIKVPMLDDSSEESDSGSDSDSDSSSSGSSSSSECDDADCAECKMRSEVQANGTTDIKPIIPEENKSQAIQASATA